MTDDPPLSRQMPCVACGDESHVFACPCGCTVPIPGLLAALPTKEKPMSTFRKKPVEVQSTGSGFVWQCPRCAVRLTSQTRAGAQQRVAEHQEACK